MVIVEVRWWYWANNGLNQVILGPHRALGQGTNYWSMKLRQGERMTLQWKCSHTPYHRPWLATWLAKVAIWSSNYTPYHGPWSTEPTFWSVNHGLHHESWLLEWLAKARVEVPFTIPITYHDWLCDWQIQFLKFESRTVTTYVISRTRLLKFQSRTVTMPVIATSEDYLY